MTEATAVEARGRVSPPIHEFLSPISDLRDDQWGGRFENRFRSGPLPGPSAYPSPPPYLEAVSLTQLPT
ncbi:MAG TPA: hypothetical protein VFG23_07880 [Polyangia bacterium]|nr:hypothetical protein [Polyangia bacterium]